MKLIEAKIKAEKPVENVDKNPDAYQIPSELAETIKSHVGKTYQAKNGQKIKIVEWIGQNYVFEKNGAADYDVIPAMFFNQKYFPAMTEVK